MRRTTAGVLLGLIFMGLLAPFATPSPDNGTGFLFVDVPQGTQITVSGVGSYIGPTALELPYGRYTVKVTGDVEVVAEVFVSPDNVTILRIDPRTIREAVTGKGITSVRAILNESANYSREKLNPPFDPFFFPGGCGGNFPYINISKPYPMGLLVRGKDEIYLTLNGTFMHLGDDEGTACVFYVDIFPGERNTIVFVRNATYTVPWARLEVSSEPKDLTVYINGGYNRYILYTPVGLYVPAIPQDVYNSTAYGFYGLIQVPVIHKLGTYTVGVAENNYLVESVVRVSPGGNYSVHVDMEKVKLALMVERKPREEVSAVMRYSTSENPAEKPVELNVNSIASQDFAVSDTVAAAFTRLSHGLEFAL